MDSINQQNGITASQFHPNVQNGPTTAPGSGLPATTPVSLHNHSRQANRRFTNSTSRYFAFTFPIRVKALQTTIAVVINIGETLDGLLTDLRYLFSNQNLHTIELKWIWYGDDSPWDMQLTSENILAVLRLALTGDVYLSCS